MIQFEGNERQDPKAPGCIECEASLTDALDGVLSPAEQARFDAHIASCATCSQMLSEAQRGAAWLEMLRTPRPEPSAALLEKILAQTSGAPLGQTDDSAEWVAPVWTEYNLPLMQPVPVLASGGNVLPFRQRITGNSRWQSLRFHLLQPRLAMTAAMAFFSVALTLSLTGVKLNQLSASNLSPSGLRRGFYDARASAARYYGNLKVVYVLESRLEDIRRSREDDESARPYQGEGQSTPEEHRQTAPEKQPEKRSAPDHGTSRREPLRGVEPPARFMPISGDVPDSSPSLSTAEYHLNTEGE
ncbi:zf-HC2 domain-containing protein [Granulicella sp. WH15]|uniref:anti-sigma factor family protein n=1 Tax=Granulicella sp. WH15 TaxID=2602070 RepID=UPI0013A55CB1|nr:zf-HC2 domain-containing protein [Granulicella sp. WH15]